MPLLKSSYTSEDYWNLPEGERAELIDGKFYDMAPPSRIHQELVSGFHYLLRTLQIIMDHAKFIQHHSLSIWMQITKTGWNRMSP